MSLITNRRRRSNASTSAPEVQENITVSIGDSTPTVVPDLLSTTGSETAQRARRAHRYNDNASSAPTALSSQNLNKGTRGVSRGLKVAKITRTTNTRIRIAVEGEHLGPSHDIHKLFVSFVGGVIRDNCPMLSTNWETVADVSQRSIMDSISVHYEISFDDRDVATYIHKCLTKAYAQWKYELHIYFQLFESADEALTHPPPELASRINEWQWLCTHFQRFAPSRIEHHGGAMPFTYRVEKHRQGGSQFPEIDNYGMFMPDPAIALHTEMLAKKTSYLKELASQTSLDSTPVPDRDAGLRILTETLGVRRGREIRGIGAGRVRDLSAGCSSSQPPSAEFQSLSNEVQQLRMANEQQSSQIQQQSTQIQQQSTQMRQMLDQLARIVPGFVVPRSVDENTYSHSSHGTDDQ